MVVHGQQPQKEIPWKVKNSLYCITYDQLFNYTYTIARKLSKYIIFQIRTINRKVMVMPIASRLVYYLENTAVWMKASGKVFQYFALSLGLPPAIKILHTFLDCNTVQVCYCISYCTIMYSVYIFYRFFQWFWPEWFFRNHGSIIFFKFQFWKK